MILKGPVTGSRGFMILSRTDAPLLKSPDTGSGVTTGKGLCLDEARKVTACNGLAHPRVAGGVGVSVLKRTKSREATVPLESGRELAKKSEPREPLSIAVTDRYGGNSPK